MDDATPRLSPADEQKAQALAAGRGLPIEQARALVAAHDGDEDTFSAALENVKSFLRAPS